jgi:hypothetical protein
MRKYRHMKNPRVRCLALSFSVACSRALGLGLAAGSAIGCATVPAVTAPGLPLKKVVIYRNGVGYFERAGHVESDRVEFRVRRNEVGDFLATLAVLERGGSSVRAAAFPMPADTSADAATKLQTVVMSLDGKQHDLSVGYIAEAPIWRPSYRLVIDKEGASLQTWGIVQNLSGEDWKDVSLSLIAEAPLAFDASLARAVIPPRPQVTDGGEVMAVVPRSETSLGQGPPPPPPAPPQAAPAQEAEGEVDADASYGAPAGNSMVKRELNRSAPAKKSAARGGGGRLMAAPAPYSARTRNLSALATVALQAGATRYEVAGTVTIPDKSATMVMLLDKRIPGEAIALFAPDSGVPDSAAHPFRVARFTNKTGGLLERGPLAIFTEGAFLGQGMTDPLPDGATATVPFALERTIAVEQKQEMREEGARLFHIEAGALTIAREQVTLTEYRLRNGADHDAKLMIKHARVAGARLVGPPPGTEDNVGTASALVPTTLAARATVKLAVDERQQVTWAIDWLAQLADDAVRAYLADRRADATVASQLRAAWEFRKVLAKAAEDREKLAAQDAELRKATQETRANLKALEKNTTAADLRARLTTRLSADATRLDGIGKRIIEVDLVMNEQRVRFNEAIRAVVLREPLSVD